MIRLLLDMGIAQSTGRHLRASGHDVVHLLEEQLACLPDDQIVAKAQEEGRAIVTHDLDFGRIVALSGRSTMYGRDELSLEFRPVAEAEVRGADEVWVTSSSKEVLAIVTLDGKPVGDGKPGPAFRRMHGLYQEFKQRVMRAGKERQAA